MPGEGNPVADLAGALGGTGTEPALELGDVCRDEEGDAAVDLVLDTPRAVDLELEDTDLALGRDPVHLGRERAVAAAHELHVLEKRPRLDPLDELSFPEEPVLPPVRLVRALRTRRRGDGDLELRVPFHEPLDQRSLAGPARAGDHEDGQWPIC